MIEIILRHGKPLTFADIYAEICKHAPPHDEADVKRSLRRALHKLASEQTLLEIGEGGPGDPLRYFFDPMALGVMAKDKAQYHALFEALEADSGAKDALAKWRAKGAAI